MEVVAGSYEGLLLGYNIVKIGNEVEMKASFTDHSHIGCIKTVAISRRGVLASGSTDETIKLLSLKKRTELGSLMHHSGSLTWLEFYLGTHMMSCSEDGTLSIWKSFTWECIKTLKGHKAAVNCLSIHPSGKLMLSVSADKTLRMWNLITGKPAYITNIKKVAELVQWSNDGELYAIVSNNTVDIYNTQTELQCTITALRKINSIAFVQNCLVYGGEGGDVFVHNLQTNSQIHNLSTNTNRIKSLVISKSVLDGTKTWMTVASSDGFIKIYELEIQQNTAASKLVVEHDTTFRLTCMAVRVHKLPTTDLTSEIQMVENSVQSQKNVEEDVKEKIVEDVKEKSASSEESLSSKHTMKQKVKNPKMDTKKDKKKRSSETKQKVQKRKKDKVLKRKLKMMTTVT